MFHAPYTRWVYSTRDIHKTRIHTRNCMWANLYFILTPDNTCFFSVSSLDKPITTNYYYTYIYYHKENIAFCYKPRLFFSYYKLIAHYVKFLSYKLITVSCLFYTTLCPTTLWTVDVWRTFLRFMVLKMIKEVNALISREL